MVYRLKDEKNKSCGSGRAWRVACLLAASMPLLLAVSNGPVCGHADSPGSPPLAPSPIRLKHRKPAEIVALFARECLPVSPAEGIPRAARSDEAESLVPSGVEAILRGNTDEVVLVGTEGVTALRHCLQVIDAPIERTGPDRAKIRLTLRQANAHRLRALVLRLPGAGAAVVTGRQLKLEGNRAWLHQAVRQVIRAELKQPESLGLPSS